MLAEIRALYLEWHAAHERAARAERKLMNSLMAGFATDPLEVAAACALRAEASSRLQAFLSATEVASRNQATAIRGDKTLRMTSPSRKPSQP